MAALAGGAATPGRRAQVIAETGEPRLATHLIELAATADPASRDLQKLRESIYARCVEAETSLIGKALFAVARLDAEARAAP
ncbi:MAG: hypothetical protein ACRCVA_35590 [Phreatobacter sp.]